MKIRRARFPASHLVSRHLPCHYSDAYQCVFSGDQNISADCVMIAFWTHSPKWIDRLFALRDLLVKPFGIQPGSNRSKEKLIDAIRTGGSHGLMRVVSKSRQETVICLSDRHLKAYFSIHVETLKTAADDCRKLTVSTIVEFHNITGRIYFYMISPFHNLVIPAMIRHALKACAARECNAK